MPRTPFIYGYHGTTPEAAERIMDVGFLLSEKQHDWLGHGIYFFEDAPRRARQWAIDRHKIAIPTVIGVKLHLENCIDLLDIPWFETLRAAYEHLRARADAENLQLPSQAGKAHRLDCRVINHAVETLINGGGSIAAIRAAFSEGNAVYPESAIYDLAHVQVAVRDPTIIVDRWTE